MRKIRENTVSYIGRPRQPAEPRSGPTSIDRALARSHNNKVYSYGWKVGSRLPEAFSTLNPDFNISEICFRFHATNCLSQNCSCTS